MFNKHGIAPSLAFMFMLAPRLCRSAFLVSFAAFVASESASRQGYPAITTGHIASITFFCVAECVNIAVGYVVWPLVFCGWLCACLPLLALRRVGKVPLLQIAVVQLGCEVMGFRMLALAATPLIYDFPKVSVSNANFCMVISWMAWLVVEDAPLPPLLHEALQFLLLFVALCAQTRVAWYI